MSFDRGRAGVAHAGVAIETRKSIKNIDPNCSIVSLRQCLLLAAIALGHSPVHRALRIDLDVAPGAVQVVVTLSVGRGLLTAESISVRSARC